MMKRTKGFFVFLAVCMFSLGTVSCKKKGKVAKGKKSLKKAKNVKRKVLAKGKKAAKKKKAVAPAVAKVGALAPAFGLPDTKGKKHLLSQYKGKYVVLEWLNHGCPFVVKHYKSKNMQSLQKKYVGKGVVWLSIVSSAPGRQGHYAPKKADELTKSKGAAPSAVLLDPEGTVGKKYAARTTPHMFILNPKQEVIYAGAIDSKRSTDPGDVKGATNYVSKALDEAMAGKKVSVPSTAPYGCSVKYKM